MFVFVGDLIVVIDDDKKVSFSAIPTEFQIYFTKYLEQRTIGGLRGPWFKERHQKPRPYREGIESRVWGLALDTLLIKVDTINFLHRSEWLFFFQFLMLECWDFNFNVCHEHVKICLAVGKFERIRMINFT